MGRTKTDRKRKSAGLLIIIGIGLYLSTTSASTATASAVINTTYELGTGDTSYQFDKVLSDYKTSSISFNQNILSYEIESYNGDIATENYNSINIQYLDALEKQSKLQEVKELYLTYKETLVDPDALAEINSQIDTVNAQIEQYKNSTYSLQVSKADARLKEEVTLFLKKNKSLVQQEAQNILTNEFLKKIYNLIVIKEQQEYYEAYQAYLVTADKVENIKYKRGLINLTSLELSQADLTKNSSANEKNNETYSQAFSYIKTETKMSENIKIILPILINQKEYNLEQTLSQFETNNSSLIQFQYLKQCYLNYWGASYGSYSLYKQTDLKIKDYQLQYDEQKSKIKDYVEAAIFSYKNAFLNQSLAETQLQLADKNYKIVLIKKDHKKATQLEVDKANYEMKSAQVSYYQSIYDIIIWQNILDNHIYGGTP